MVQLILKQPEQSLTGHNCYADRNLFNIQQGLPEPATLEGIQNIQDRAFQKENRSRKECTTSEI